jgi:hypothetical protein
LNIGKSIALRSSTDRIDGARLRFTVGIVLFDLVADSTVVLDRAAAFATASYVIACDRSSSAEYTISKHCNLPSELLDVD